MCRDSTTARGPAIWPILADQAEARRHVCSCLPRKSFSTSCILGVVAGRLRVAGDGLSCHLRSRASESSRGRRARSEAEAQARRGCARSSGASPRGAGYAGTSGAGYAGRAARCQDDCPQPGPQYHLRADRDGADHDQPNTIEALPQGENATVEKILLQLPGVTQDSAASGSLHVRNEHANVQIRINGIMFPDGVSDFGTFLDTALIGPSFTSD